MTAYKIVSGNTTSEVQNEVNRLISEGWVPQGGLTCMTLECWDYPTYAQAMVLQ